MYLQRDQAKKGLEIPKMMLGFCHKGRQETKYNKTSQETTFLKLESKIHDAKNDKVWVRG